MKRDVVVEGRVEVAEKVKVKMCVYDKRDPIRFLDLIGQLELWGVCLSEWLSSVSRANMRGSMRAGGLIH
jgi:hypothetical protein